MIPPLPHLLGVAASSMVAFSCHHPSSPAAMDAGTLLAGMISLECLSSYGKASNSQHLSPGGCKLLNPSHIFLTFSQGLQSGEKVSISKPVQLTQ